MHPVLHRGRFWPWVSTSTNITSKLLQDKALGKGCGAIAEMRRQGATEQLSVSPYFVVVNCQYITVSLVSKQRPARCTALLSSRGWGLIGGSVFFGWQSMEHMSWQTGVCDNNWPKCAGWIRTGWAKVVLLWMMIPCKILFFFFQKQGLTTDQITKKLVLIVAAKTPVGVAIRNRPSMSNRPFKTTADRRLDASYDCVREKQL